MKPVFYLLVVLAVMGLAVAATTTPVEAKGCTPPSKPCGEYCC